MFDNLSPKVLKIINLMKFYSHNQGIKKIGSEYLLIAMLEQNDTLCKFLFEEYQVTKEELLEETKNINIIRKNDKEYTSALENIFKEAIILSKNTTLSDEHIFMAILKTQSIANEILTNLGFDLEDLELDIKEIYEFDNNDEIEFTTNITKLAKDNKLNVFVNRDSYVKRMDVILRRKLKSNPLLIGNAGVGKTALIEGLALHYHKLESNYEIYSLNLASMLAGTKYRGDFEKRIEDLINSVINRDNVILFIDEIHTIVGTGTTEGSLDVANILKPALARGNFKLIGATTPQEYHKFIEKDKALNRRFQTIFITEPSIDETKTILKGIKESYIKHHNVNIDNNHINYLVVEATRRLTKRYNPDKSIDVLDEVLASCSFKNIKDVSNFDIDQVIDNIIGVKNNIVYDNLNYPNLSKHITLNKMGLNINKVLLKLKYNGNNKGLDLLISDLKRGYGVTDEMLLKLDLENYADNHSISSLIGTSPGYIGYSDEGILSGHILRYPASIIIVNNYNKGHITIKNFVKQVMTTGSFTDKSGNYICCQNTIFIIQDNSKVVKPMGYFTQDKSESLSSFYDETITYIHNKETTYNKQYKESLKKYDIDVDLLVDVILENKHYIDNIVLELLKNKKTGKVTIYKDENLEYKYDQRQA